MPSPQIVFSASSTIPDAMSTHEQVKYWFSNVQFWFGFMISGLVVWATKRYAISYGSKRNSLSSRIQIPQKILWPSLSEGSPRSFVLVESPMKRSTRISCRLNGAAGDEIRSVDDIHADPT